MGKRIRPLNWWHIGVEFSVDEWAKLASSFELPLSIEVQADALPLSTEVQNDTIPLSKQVHKDILACVNEYVSEAISHHQAAPREKVESTLEKIIKATKRAAEELTNMFEAEGSIKRKEPPNAYYVIKTHIETAHEKKLGKLDPEAKFESMFDERLLARELHLAPLITSLNHIKSLGEFSLGILKSDEETAVQRDIHLDVFLHKVVNIFSDLGKSGWSSQKCIDFVHAICVLVHEHLKSFYGKDHIFDNLRNVVDVDPKAGKWNIISRIENGRSHFGVF